MFRPSAFRDLVSGRRQDAAARLLRAGLRVVETPYTWAVRWRNRRYDRGRAPIHRVEVPVVSVGNLTLGGTGKTPLVAWLAQWAVDRGLRPAIVSRGYGGAAGGENDEARELAQKLPGVTQYRNADRVAAAREAVAAGAQIIVLDDAFQHRRLHRDLDIVLLDATEPFGFGHVFPRGTLREPVDSLRRAGVVILSRADLLPVAARADILCEVRRWSPQSLWAEVVYSPRSLISPDGRRTDLDEIEGKAVAAFCGIGNPAGFRHTLQRCGFRLAGFREFPDHHRYTVPELRAVADWAAGLPAEAIVCTQKDLVKIPPGEALALPVWAIAIEPEFLTGRAELEARLATPAPTDPRGR